MCFVSGGGFWFKNSTKLMEKKSTKNCKGPPLPRSPKIPRSVSGLGAGLEVMDSQVQVGFKPGGSWGLSGTSCSQKGLQESSNVTFLSQAEGPRAPNEVKIESNSD